MPYHTANTAAGTLGNKAESTWLFARAEPSFFRAAGQGDEGWVAGSGTQTWPHHGREPEEEEE